MERHVARTARRDDEDALDPTEAADVVTDDESEDLDVDDVDVDDVDVEDADDAEPDADVFDDEEVEPDVAEDEAELPIAGFDEDAEDAPVILADDDDDDDELDSIGDGEFVCRSCFMAKRESALADAKRILCRDCA